MSSSSYQILYWVEKISVYHLSQLGFFNSDKLRNTLQKKHSFAVVWNYVSLLKIKHDQKNPSVTVKQILSRCPLSFVTVNTSTPPRGSFAFGLLKIEANAAPTARWPLESCLTLLDRVRNRAPDRENPNGNP